MKSQLERVDLSLRKNIFSFCIAQGYELNKDFDKCFYHFKSGNQIKNNQSKYSIEGMDKETR